MSKEKSDDLAQLAENGRKKKYLEERITDGYRARALIIQRRDREKETKQSEQGCVLTTAAFTHGLSIVVDEIEKFPHYGMNEVFELANKVAEQVRPKQIKPHYLYLPSPSEDLTIMRDKIFEPKTQSAWLFIPNAADSQMKKGFHMIGIIPMQETGQVLTFDPQLPNNLDHRVPFSSLHEIITFTSQRLPLNIAGVIFKKNRIIS